MLGCPSRVQSDHVLEVVDIIRARDGRPSIVSELLEGEELSVFAVSAGSDLVALPASRDYSRVGDDDTGPNTGGMGSYSPVPEIDQSEVAELVETIHRPVVEELAERGTPFIGCLYGGLMLTADGPRVLEFNCRFGDPETQVILPRLDGDLAEALLAGDLSQQPEVADRAAVTVVLSGGGYPERSDQGTPIEGVEAAEATGALVFHAGTALHDGRLVTNGGRILNVVGVGATVAEARTAAYDAAAHIDFAGMHLRTDIASNV